MQTKLFLSSLYTPFVRPGICLPVGKCQNTVNTVTYLPVKVTQWSEHAVMFSDWKGRSKCRVQFGLNLLFLSIHVYHSAFKPLPTEPHSKKLSHDMLRSGRRALGFSMQSLRGRVLVNISWRRRERTSNRWRGAADTQTNWGVTAKGNQRSEQRGLIRHHSVMERTTNISITEITSGVDTVLIKLPVVAILTAKRQ